MILNMKLTHVWCWICQTCQNANNQFILAGFCSLSQGISSQEGVSPSARPRNSFNIPSHQCWRFLWVESLPPRCSMGKYDIVRWSKAVFSLIASDQRQYDNANRISLKISSLSFFGCFLHWRRRIAWYSFMSIMNFFVNLGSSPSSSNFCPNKKYHPGNDHISPTVWHSSVDDVPFLRVGCVSVSTHTDPSEIKTLLPHCLPLLLRTNILEQFVGN